MVNEFSDFYLYLFVKMLEKSLELGFALIFYFICKHFHFECIVKEKEKIRSFYKNFGDFLKFFKSNFVRSKFFKLRSSITLLWGHARSHTKFGPDRLSRFEFWRLLDTKKNTKKNRHPDRKTSKVDI